jgi:hypothetical protein
MAMAALLQEGRIGDDSIQSKKGGEVMNAENVATVEVKLDFNLSLLLYQSQCVLERYGLDVSMFDTQELLDSWTVVIRDHLKAWALDTDHFLANNGKGDAFVSALLET